MKNEGNGMSEKIGWFIGYNSARVYTFIEEFFFAVIKFIKDIPINLKLIYIKYF